MASWVTHLRIAARLGNLLPDIIPNAFNVGNVAPDSGVPQPDGTYYPDKRTTHFKVHSDKGNIIGATLFYQRFLHNCEWPAETYSFLLGYFCHLATDNLWLKHFARFAKLPDWKAAVAMVDTCYLQEHPLQLDLRPISIPTNILPFLNDQLIQLKLQTMRLEANRAAEAIPSAANQQSVDAIQSFIVESSRLIYNII